MIRFFERTIHVLIVASFFMPLVLGKDSFIFPFIVPKIIFFRTVSILMLLGFSLLLIQQWKKYRIRPTAITITISLFFLSFFLSTFIGIDWYRIFWDNHERMLGLFTLLHYFIYYLVISSVVREWKDWRMLLRSFLVIGSIAMLIGFIQRFINPDFLLNRGAARVSATLGNAIYFSGYGLFLFVLGIFLATKETVSSWKWTSIALGVLGLLGVFMGGTRGTLLGLLFGVFATCCIYAFAFRKNKTVRHASVGILALVIILSAFLFSFRETSFVTNLPAVGRLVNTSISGGTANTRIMAWEIAIDSWKEKPLFGWGPNNYYYAFNKHYRPEFLRFGLQETWFDNAHSSLFNTLAVQGIIGILLYIGIFFVPFLILIRAYRRDRIGIHLFAIGVGFLIAHFIHNATVFENPTSYLYFFFFLAFVNQQMQLPQEDNGEEKPLSKVAVAVVGLIFLSVIYLTNVNVATANTNTLRSIQAMYRAEIDNMFSLYALAESAASPHQDDIRNDIARQINTVVPQYAEQNRPQDAVKLLRFAIGESSKNRTLHPLDIRVHIVEAQLLQQLGQFTNDGALLIEAEQILETGLSHSPKRQQIIYLLTFLKLQLGKQQEAISLMQSALSYDPEIEESWWRLALAYVEINDLDNAKQTIVDAQNQGIVFKGHGKSVVDSILGAAVVEIDTTP